MAARGFTNPSHTHTVVGDSSANQTFNFDTTTILYDKKSGKVSFSNNGNYYEDVKSPYNLIDIFGDILGSVIQDGGDIQLFKAMISEKLKEVIDEFQVGGNK